MEVYLGFGSNLGNREETIRSALSLLAAYSGLTIETVSSIIRTKPYGYHNQPDFLNCVARVSTELDAHTLLEIAQTIEHSFNRKRVIKWGPRTLDIDILFYGQEIIETQELIIPHPGTGKRLYLLESLQEICPDYIHPILKRSIKDLYRILRNV